MHMDGEQKYIITWDNTSFPIDFSAKATKSSPN